MHRLWAAMEARMGTWKQLRELVAMGAEGAL